MGGPQKRSSVLSRSVVRQVPLDATAEHHALAAIHSRGEPVGLNRRRSPSWRHA